MKYDFIPNLFWIAVGILATALSYRMNIKGLHNPGPGFMPFILGILLTAIAFIHLVFTRKETIKKVTDVVLLSKKVSVLFPSLLLYCILMPELGYTVSTAILLLLLFRTNGLKWQYVILLSFLTVAITYFGFTALGIRFPTGVF